MRPGCIVAVCVLFALTSPAAADPPVVDSQLAARAVWLAPASDSIERDDEPALPPDDPWFGPDKALHFGASFLITLSGQYVLVSKMDMREQRAWPVSAGTSLALGLFKELADSQRPVRPLFSWRDMAWNAAGVTTAVLIILI